MNYLDIKHCNMVNGDGLRTVIWVSGCDRNCKGCFSPHSHDPNAGVPFDEKAKEELFADSKESWCDGITFLGGDPMYCGNREVVASIAAEYKERVPDKTIWLYTGYTWDDIVNDESMSGILKYVDVVVDGAYVEELRSIELPWVGSSNQHVIDVKKRLRTVSDIFKASLPQRI